MINQNLMLIFHRLRYPHNADCLALKEKAYYITRFIIILKDMKIFFILFFNAFICTCALEFISDKNSFH